MRYLHLQIEEVLPEYPEHGEALQYLLSQISASSQMHYNHLVNISHLLVEHSSSNGHTWHIDANIETGARTIPRQWATVLEPLGIGLKRKGIGFRRNGGQYRFYKLPAWNVPRLLFASCSDYNIPSTLQNAFTEAIPEGQALFLAGSRSGWSTGNLQRGMIRLASPERPVIVLNLKYQVVTADRAQPYEEQNGWINFVGGEEGTIQNSRHTNETGGHIFYCPDVGQISSRPTVEVCANIVAIIQPMFTATVADWVTIVLGADERRAIRIRRQLRDKLNSHRISFLANLNERHNHATRDVEAYETRFAQAIRDLVETQAELDNVPAEISPDHAFEQIEQGVVDINALDIVNSAWLNDLVLHIKTKMLYVAPPRPSERIPEPVRKRLGEVELKWDLLSTNAPRHAIFGRNLTLPERYPGCHFIYNEHHNGWWGACWGSGVRTAARLHAEIKVLDLAIYVISFLEAVPGTDGYSEFLRLPDA